MYKTDGRTMQELVDADKKWQKLRDELRGTWKGNEFRNCHKLKQYMGGSVQSATNVQLVIVMNYLTGTGFRTGAIKSPEITKLRKDISIEVKSRKENGKWFK